MNNPTPEEIKAARKLAGLTQEQAAALVYVKRDGWIRWEHGIRKMHPGMWELFLSKVKEK